MSKHEHTRKKCIPCKSISECVCVYASALSIWQNGFFGFCGFGIGRAMAFGWKCPTHASMLSQSVSSPLLSLSQPSDPLPPYNWNTIWFFGSVWCCDDLFKFISRSRSHVCQFILEFNEFFVAAHDRPSPLWREWAGCRTSVIFSHFGTCRVHGCILESEKAAWLAWWAWERLPDWRDGRLISALCDSC